MADTKYAVLASSPERLNVISTKLGSAKGEKITDKDIKKAMKMGLVSNYEFCQPGDDLEGFLDNVDGGPTAGGFVFGGVAHPDPGFRVEALVDQSQATALKPRDQVVAGTQAALGVQSLPTCKAGTGVVFKYRVISLQGDGKKGTVVVLERC